MGTAAAGYIALEIARGRVLIPTDAKCALRGLGRDYFSPGFSRKCTRRSVDRLIEIRAAHDRCINPRERNPIPTPGGHGFNFQMARLIAAAKVIHKKYGIKMIAAAGATRENSRIVQPKVSHSATMSNKLASIF